MLNKVVLIGRLTRDPDLKYTSNGGVAVANFSLAVNRKFANQQGEYEADFINIVTWRNLAEDCANYLKKGSLIAIDGRIQTRKYEDKEGRTIYVTEVVAEDVRFLDTKGSKPKSNDDNQDPFAGDGQPVDISEDDLPF